MPSPPSFLPWQDDYIRQHYPTGNTREIAEHLGRDPQRIRTRAHELGVAKAPGAKAKRIGQFTPEMDDQLRQIYHLHTNAEIAQMMGLQRVVVADRAVVLGLRKPKELLSRTISEALLRAGKRPGQFKKGLVPWNKGVKGYSVAMGRGHFKPGNRPPTWVPVGTERWTTPPKAKPDAPRYIKRKVAEPNVWRLVHRITWEQHYGPIPRGHIVVFRDSDSSNCAPANLACIPRSDLGVANGAGIPYHFTGVYRALVGLQKAIKDNT